jgi:predicted TIM-barrel fold metal-dependent hydrolase
MVPFHLQRLDDMLPPSVTRLPRTITETYLNHVWVTPSGLFDLPHFQFIHTIIGADRIIWSVDYPSSRWTGSREFLAKVLAKRGKPDDLDLTARFRLACQAAPRLALP